MDESALTKLYSTAHPAPAQATAYRNDLWQLLARQTRLYTMGDSSSVPVETAQDLLQSIRFCVDLASEHAHREAGEAVASLSDLFARGREEVERLAAEARQLYDRVLETRLPYGQLSYEETLEDLELFFRRYDSRFFAHHIPCMITYPLHAPVEEALLGIRFIHRYLRHLLLENQFCGRFDTQRMAALHRTCCPQWMDYLVNLYEPVAFCALGLVLLGRDPLLLAIPSADLGELVQRAADADGAALTEAAHGLAAQLDLAADDAAYLGEAALSLHRRLLADTSRAATALLFAAVPPAAVEQASPGGYRDNPRMADTALRAFIDDINGCRNVDDKLAAIHRQVHSLRDLTEILDTCIWEGELPALLGTLDPPALAWLLHTADTRLREERGCSASGWEQALCGHIRGLDAGRRNQLRALQRTMGLETQ